jgi:GT2 family glycosyltransferase
VLVFHLLRYTLSRVFGPKAKLINPPSLAPCPSVANSQPMVTIIIPTRDKPELLRNCINSIKRHTEYANYEILVVNNQSIQLETLILLNELRSLGIKIVDYDFPFNFSAMCNLAVRNSTAEFVCLLNNDTTVLRSNWLSSLVGHAQGENTGWVGCLLVSENGLIQHSGLALGFRGIAEHAYIGESLDLIEPSAVVESCREVSAVTFACAVIARAKYDELAGLNEDFPVGLNDVDCCIRSMELGYKNIFCSSSVLTHLESSSRPKALSVLGAKRAIRDVLQFLSLHPFSKLKDSHYC